jgi:hypothetical protein
MRTTTSRFQAWLLLGFCLLANVLYQRQNPPARIDVVDLGTPPPAMLLRTAALGENAFAGYLVMMFLQNVDVPVGRATPLADLDRNTVIRWLDLGQDLDPDTGYSLLLAARHYAETGSPAQRRMMLDWVYRRFAERPNQRWPWLAHAVFVARHVLHDNTLAEFYAAALRTQVTDPNVPSWVRQMDLLLRADLGETADARVILGGLIAAGQIRSSAELKFLESRVSPEPSPPSVPSAGPNPP